jgi:hypothetical protein
MRRCPRCLSVGLVCLCLSQGVKAPPAAAVSWIVSGPAVVTSSTASTSTVFAYSAVNAVTGGKPYDVSPQRPQLYGEYGGRPKPTGAGDVRWSPPDLSKIILS